MINLRSVKTQFIIFLVCYALFLAIKEKDAVFLVTTFLSVTFAIGTESLILYKKERKFTVTESSVISGLIISYVLSSDSPWWVFAITSFLAISSKHLIRFQKKHIFNPAAFGIFLAIILFGAKTQWKGTYIWYIIAPFGFYFISKIRKIELLFGYGITTFILFGAQAAMQKTSIFNIFDYLSYFYIFIMLIEPKTAPIKSFAKLLFGAGTAILIFFLTEKGAKFDVELFSLLVFNLTVPILNKLANMKRGE